jgi:UDP-glucose 4-epimerase
MNILLTGGSGFIGRNIKESFLNDKHAIMAPSRKELDLFDDKSAEQFFINNSFDVVIHAAARPGHRNAPAGGYLTTNSRMLFNLLKYKDSWGRLINMGSGAIYDMTNYQPKMKEEYFGTHIPSDEHGFTKYIFGKMFPFLKNVVDLRLFGVFGKYEDYAIRFISNAICKTLFDVPVTLRQNRKFDYLYIDDLMPILDHFISHDLKYSEYNITPDKSSELMQIAMTIRNISSRDIDIKVTQEGMGLEYSGDNARLKKEMKGLCFTPIESSVEALYKWYASNKGILRKEYLLNDR